MLTLKQIEKISTKIHAPLVGKAGVILSEEDEKKFAKNGFGNRQSKQENLNIGKFAKGFP